MDEGRTLAPPASRMPDRQWTSNGRPKVTRPASALTRYGSTRPYILTISEMERTVLLLEWEEMPVRRALILLALLLIVVASGLAAAPAASSPASNSIGSPAPFTPSSTPTPHFYCQGEYTSRPSGSTDMWITVACPFITSICSCNAAGVVCGTNSQSPPEGYTYIGGTCQKFSLNQ